MLARGTPAENLARFISETRTNELTHTHVLLGAPFGKINVGNSKMHEFWELYMDVVNNEPHLPIYLAEKPLTELPVLVDIDLKTRLTKSVDPSKHIYTQNQVRAVVRAYQNALRNEVLVDAPESAMVCVLLEKNPYIIELNGIKYVKNGFHLHFPKCFIDTHIQEAYIIPIVKQRLAGLFDNLYTLDDGSDETKQTSHHYDFIDPASIKVHWLLYGSKKPANSVYVATKCFADSAKEIDFEEALGDYVLPKLTGTKSSVSCSGQVIKLLPRILSTRLYGRLQYHCKPKPSVATPIFESLAYIKTKRPEYEQKTVSDLMAEVGELLPLISDKRAEDRSDWLAVGFCLWNITKGDEDGLMAWLEFSDRSEKCNEAECICLWNTMRENNYTLGTLKYYAKTDSPRDYAEICKQRGDNLIAMAVEGGHNDLAKLLYNVYGEEFVYSTSNDTWYRFVDHVWRPYRKTCFDLSERISDNNGAIIAHFSRHIAEAQSELNQIGTRRRDDDATDFHQKLVKKKISTLEKLIKQCKTSAFKQSVMKECQEVFRNDNFVSKLNTNPYLVAFLNGIYDFKNDCFRDGKPEDYLSKTVAIPYKDYGTIDNPDVMEVAEFFRKVLVDDKVRDYFLDQVCQLFVGGNEDKVILIWTGTGDNGKSVTQRLFEKMLGPLAVKISTSLITGKKANMGQAAPELARTGDGVRWLAMDEPSQDEQITTGLLKSLTGNDSYWARDLYKGGEDTKEIVPLYKMHMLCNKLPPIKKPDDAFWNRIRVIPFESKFLPEEKCPSTYEEQISLKIFPNDAKFMQRIDNMLQPLAWYLISHWRGLRKSDRVVPDKVKIATGEYREENSDTPVQSFVEEYLTADCLEHVSVEDVYSVFKRWFKSEYQNEKQSAKRTVLAEFDKLMGKREGSVWNNWSWKETDQSRERRLANPMLK